MSWPGTITVMAEIRKGRENEVAKLVETEIDAQPCICRKPFCDLPGLHCCAFLIVPAEDGLPAYLVLEATFDGAAAEFVHDLVDADFIPKGRAEPLLSELFGHCVAFPASAKKLPRSMGEYLLAHAMPNNTFFSGVVGFPVARIQAENSLRKTVRNELTTIAVPPDPPPSTYAGVIRQIRRKLRAGGHELRLLEERAEIPWQVRFSPMFRPVQSTIMALGLALIGAVLLRVAGIGFADLFGAAWDVLHREGRAAAPLWMALIFAGFRLAEVIARSHDRPSLDAALRDIAAGIASACSALAAAVLLLAVSVCAAFGPYGAGALISAVLALVLRWILALPLNEVLRRAALPGLAPARRAQLAAGRDILVLLRRAAICYALIAFLSIPGWGPTLVVALAWLATVLACVAIGLAPAVVILALLFAWVRRMERREAADRLPASLLATRTLKRSAVWEREEHGVNRSHNHFASVTWVKPGWLRLCLLKVMLWLVNIAARYRDNRGRLGEIPTIVSARWLLFDGGRRLLFLTNYFGPWDAYLGEFSELNAHVGVNAIWSNTQVRLDADQAQRFGTDGAREVNWPQTRFMFWGGATHEEHFKAYVRQSQIRTCAWYGAYPDLSVPNIHENAQLRSVIFGTPTLSEIDDALDRL